MFDISNKFQERRFPKIAYLCGFPPYVFFTDIQTFLMTMNTGEFLQSSLKCIKSTIATAHPQLWWSMFVSDMVFSFWKNSFMSGI